MNIHELKTTPIERIENASSDQVVDIISQARRPLIFSGLDKDFEFLQKWNLDFFSTMDDKVPVQKPESDGVNYFVKYFRMPMAEFATRIKAGENLYIGAREIMKEGGERSDKDGLGKLYTTIKLPKWIERARIWSTNLWVGAGNNRTLLHYDPWDGILMLGAGTKEFIVLPSTETPKVYPFSAFNFRALYKGAVLHSKIRPLNVQKQYQKKFSKAEGFRGTITAGEMIYIPAGFWHYVESSGLNISINFFIHFKDRSLQLHEPLRTYWIKDNITLWPIRWFFGSRAFAGGLFRQLFPKKTTT